MPVSNIAVTATSTHVTKAETKAWIEQRIKPLNGGRFATHKGASKNCVLLAEKCVKVLLKQEEPKQVPAKKISPAITYRNNDQGKVVYHSIERAEQAHLLPFKEFTNTIDLLADRQKVYFDLTVTNQSNEVKYVVTKLDQLAEDIKSLPGSSESSGNDKTLTGIIYYYYEGMPAGHLANFYRDLDGNVFFVDAQNESVTESPPSSVLDYKIRNEVFYFVVPPISGFYIKKEKKDIFIKEEVIEEPIKLPVNDAEFYKKQMEDLQLKLDAAKKQIEKQENVQMLLQAKINKKDQEISDQDKKIISKNKEITQLKNELFEINNKRKFENSNADKKQSCKKLKKDHEFAKNLSRLALLFSLEGDTVLAEKYLKKSYETEFNLYTFFGTAIAQFKNDKFDSAWEIVKDLKEDAAAKEDKFISKAVERLEKLIIKNFEKAKNIKMS